MLESPSSSGGVMGLGLVERPRAGEALRAVEAMRTCEGW